MSQYQKRLSICQECPTFNPKTKICSKTAGGCGCYIPIKARLNKSKCPKEKW